MTVFMRGSVFLNCLICGYGEFEIIRNYRTRGNAMMYKRCGFTIKNSGYFDPMSKGTSVTMKGPSPFTARKKNEIEMKIIKDGDII